MSFMNGVFLENEYAARQAKILARAVNTVEKGNILAVFTGGGFRLYDKNTLTLLFRESGMDYVYDGEISPDLSRFAMKSRDGYALIYKIPDGSRLSKLRLTDRKTTFTSSAGRGCCFGKTSDTFYDIVYSETLCTAVVNKYDLITMAKTEVYFSDSGFDLNDIGFSTSENKFWITGSEREAYAFSDGKAVFSGSRPFLLWTEDFANIEVCRPPHELGYAVYDEKSSLFHTYSAVCGREICDRYGAPVK